MLVLEFFVEGEPVAWPKKQYRVVSNPGYVPGGRQPANLIRDYKRRSKKDPGGFKRWSDLVRFAAEQAIREKGDMMLFPLARKVPLEVTCTFWRTRAKSNKTIYPTTRPDGDNLQYLIHNVLEGVVWEDDSQIIRWPGAKAWADPHIGYTPGCEIKVRVLDEIVNPL